jgi:hypothetical protein
MLTPTPTLVYALAVPAIQAFITQVLVYFLYFLAIFSVSQSASLCIFLGAIIWTFFKQDYNTKESVLIQRLSGYD